MPVFLDLKHLNIDSLFIWRNRLLLAGYSKEDPYCRQISCELLARFKKNAMSREEE